jgi:hypothetical protein
LIQVRGGDECDKKLARGAHRDVLYPCVVGEFIDCPDRRNWVRGGESGSARMVLEKLRKIPKNNVRDTIV